MIGYKDDPWLTNNNLYIVFFYRLLFSFQSLNIVDMPHHIDKLPVDRKAAQNLARAHKWHAELNNRLERKGHRPEHMFNRAISEARRLHVASHNTVKIAHQVRKNGNDARHNF